MIQLVRRESTPSPEQFNLRFRSASASVQGSGRDQNEDAVSVSADGQLLIVADGIGGAAAGELASKLAVDTIQTQLERTFTNLDDGFTDVTDLLNAAICEANHRVVQLGREREHRGAGATVVIGVVTDRYLHVQSAGDSRAYLIRGHEIEQLTVDDSFTQMLLSCGWVSQEAARTHPRRNVLLRALGQHDFAPNPEAISRLLEAGDRILICTDGLSDFVEDEQLRKVIVDSETPRKAADSLLQAAQEAGSTDDTTCVVTFVE